MAAIKMKRSVATREKGVARSLVRGREYDVPEATAKRYVEAGHAERVGGKTPAKKAASSGQSKPPRKRAARKRPAKKSQGGAPANKNAGAAPEDKG